MTDDLLRAIVAQPDQDGPRLAYADRLAEAGGTRPCAAAGCEGGRVPVYIEYPYVTCQRCGRSLVRRDDAGQIHGGILPKWCGHCMALHPADYEGDRPCETCRGRGWLPDATADRAEFVRVQVRMGEIRRGCGCGACVQRRGGGQHHNGPCGVDGRQDDGTRLRWREQELFDRWRDEWFPQPERGDPWIAALRPDPAARVPTLLVERGFADTVLCSPWQWVGGLCGECDGRGSVFVDMGDPLACEACGGVNVRLAGEPDRVLPHKAGNGLIRGVAVAACRAHPVGRVLCPGYVRGDTVFRTGGRGGHAGDIPAAVWSTLGLAACRRRTTGCVGAGTHAHLTEAEFSAVLVGYGRRAAAEWEARRAL